MSSGFGDSPWAVAALLASGVLLLYLGRTAGHGAIRALTHALRDAFHAADRHVMAAQDRLARRNREVLLDAGRNAAENTIAREFERVAAVVERDLSGYPALHRRLSEQIQSIDEDYRRTSEVPPSPPEWTRAVEGFAENVPSKSDPIVGRILGDIHKTLDASHRDAMKAYRDSCRGRHKLLEKMLPYWRRLDRTLGRVDGTIRGLGERSAVIDQQMKHYERIRADADTTARTLHASSTTQFFTSAFVLVIALLGGFINFHLIALPMSEMVGATSHVGGLMVSDIAALVIIMTEVAMGLFLMESLRITRLFPLINQMDDRMRRRMVWVSLVILTTLAMVESSLAYMRDLLAADREALTQVLAGAEVAQAQMRWIPSIGQMVMGFMLPFALTFAAIPLESFIESSRVVFGTLVEGLLRAFAVLMRLAAGLCEGLGTLLVHVYDFMIVVPLKLEALALRKTPRTPAPQELL